MSLIICKSAATISRIKSSLGIDVTNVIEDATHSVSIEECESRKLWLCASPSMRLVQIAIDLVPQVEHIGFLLNGAPRHVRVANLPANGKEIRTAAEFGQIVAITEQEREKLNERIFTNRISISPAQLMGLLFHLHAHTPEADEERKRPLPEEWNTRLSEGTVEPAKAISEDDNRCVICVEDRQRSVLFIPCDHCVCCEICARTMMENKSECPICRTPVDDVRRIKRV